MNLIEGSDRNQSFLLPPTIEEYVSEDNPVRLLDAFVDGLDLRAFGFVFPKENRENRGRPAYDPRCMVKLYLYGYLHRIRSSRRLEQECARNLELMWLMGNLKPDFKTIADFRKNNVQAFKMVVRAFNELCRKLKLFGGELFAIDGTKIKGQNAANKNWSVAKLQKQNQKLEKRLAEYLKALDESDQDEPAPISAAELKQKIEQIKKQKQGVDQKLQAMEQAGQTQVSLTDPESRSMKGAKSYIVGYNVQGAVDSKHHLVACTTVSNSPVDQGQLAPMVQAIKEQMQVQSAEVVADGGYFSVEDIKSCQQLGMEPHLPQVNNSPSERAGLFGKEHFQYDPIKDCYQCPAGQQLKKRREVIDKGQRRFNYDNPAACAQCRLKGRCTGAKFRTVSRCEDEACVKHMAAVVAAAPQKLALRKTLIEHFWGTFKWLMPEGFLLKGLKKVEGEVALVHFAYNFKRALKVVGWDKLLKMLLKPKSPADQQGRKQRPDTNDGILAFLRLFDPARAQHSYWMAN